MSEKSEKDSKAFQAYLDNIKAKTGLTPADFRQAAQAKGFVFPGTKAGEVVQWLQADYDLGRGHAMAIYGVLSSPGGKPKTKDSLDGLFAGNKAAWRKPFDALVAKVSKFGPDVEVGAGKTYVTLTRGAKKFGIVQVTSERMDIGIKRKGVAPTGRFEAAGSWNAMVTHRVRISDAKQIDTDVISWLKRAYEAA
jgi:hypothetical protein